MADQVPIAIVGMGGVFPGAPDLDAFAHIIANGVDATRPVPDGRWPLPPQDLCDPAGGPDKAFHSRAGYIDDFSFDAADLNLPPALLEDLDPLFQITLHAGRQAFADGQTDDLDRERVGVSLAAIALPTDGSSALTAAVWGRDFQKRLFNSAGFAAPSDENANQPPNPLNSQVTAMPAGLLAAALRLGGGTLTLDAACASSLYAIKIACDELRSRRVDAILAGGVSRPDCLFTQMGFSQLQALSPSGTCRTFDDAADGLIVGEGAGIVLLKRLDDAIAAGDHIYAVIRGLGLSNDTAGSLLAADAEGQIRAMRSAYKQAGWKPSDVDLIECHGTGTPTGDAAEITSLHELWKDCEASPHQCPIGSIKANIGHLLTAAGAAGLIKVLLSMQAKQLPAAANFATPAAQLASSESPFCVPTQAAPWNTRDKKTPRRAAVSAFGFGGINAHVLLEEHQPKKKTKTKRKQTNVSSSGVPIAIIGVSARVGDVESVPALHALLHNEQSALRTRQPDRWRTIDSADREEYTALDHAGAFIDHVAIGIGEFRMPPSEIPEILPQQLLALDVVAEAVRDANIDLAASRLRTGVIVGMAIDYNATNYHHRWLLLEHAHRWTQQFGLQLSDEQLATWVDHLRGQSGPALNAPRVVGALGNILASRIAREYGLGGPSFAISADAVSGLRAIDFAVGGLQRDELDVAFVAAADLPGDLRNLLATSRLRRTLHGNAAAAPIGEGAAAFVLKRLPDALAAGDAVHAVIRGVGFANSGLSASAATSAQQRARMQACQSANVAADDGDTIETLSIDAITPNIGHAGAAAGMLAATAAVLRFASNDATESRTKQIGVSATGLDGNAAHLLLESAPLEAKQPTSTDVESQAETKQTIAVPTGGPAPQPQFPTGNVPHVQPPPAISVSADQVPALTLAGVISETNAATTRAHEAYLRFSEDTLRQMGHGLALQAQMLGALPQTPGTDLAAANLTAPAPSETTIPPQPVAFPREKCMEFATGLIANVLGPQFAEVDAYRARVRLPDEPLMLVDRILTVDAEINSLTGGTLVTEHDVHPGAWYLDGNKAPVCIAVEAGQADLFLCSYLGIDLRVKGERTYRLLDATVHFHRGLPEAGEIIRYDITIDRFLRQGETYLFFFRFEGTIAGQPMLSMTGGCAGFFTEKEIEDSGGIVLTAEETQPKLGKRCEDWRELVPMQRESYSEAQLDALRNGDLAACFGPAFAGLPLHDPLRIPHGRMRLVHRVVELDPAGGRYGLGVIRAEADIHPDDWFLTCHFVDDMVMPGTLMYECCAHTLRVLLLRMGWVGEQAGVCYEPCIDVPAKLKCRGPVTPETKVVTYEVQLKEIGYGPEPYVIADALMYADGDRIVQFTDMSMRITGLTREQIEDVWNRRESEASTPNQQASTPIGDEPISASAKLAIFDTQRILDFAIGNPSDAFGAQYKPFDHDRRLARLPGPPFAFLSRITETHSPQWRISPGGWIEAQYDVPADAWYFRANRQQSMPFAVLLEAPLQACGWLAAYNGSALCSQQDLCFRNLDGEATLLEEIFPDAGTLTLRVRMTNATQAGDTLLQDYALQVWQQQRLVYDGLTTFGFFTKEALAQQVGIRGAQERRHTPDVDEIARGDSFPLEDVAPLEPNDTTTVAHAAAAMPARAWRMIDEIDLYVPDGGPHGLGYVRGIKHVNPDEWFFAAHFYQDPVWPGSLGLEALLQLLKVAALKHWPQYVNTHRFQPIAVGAPHKWAYRGQVLPTAQRVTVEVAITRIADNPEPTIWGSGFLTVDGTTIYEMTDFSTRLVPQDS